MQPLERSSFLFPILLLLSTLQAVQGIPVHSQHCDSVVRTVYEWPNITWAENLAVRSNGEILVTLINKPEVWLVDPFADNEAKLVATFPDVYGGAMGISEVEPDVFAVAVGNWSIVTFKSTPGSYAVYRIDMSCYSASTGPVVTKVTDMPQASFLNGMTTLTTLHHTVLIGDSDLGEIWRVNILTGGYELAILDPSLQPLALEIVLGVNGIQQRDSFLYFTNSLRFALGRIPINSSGSATGKPEIIDAIPPYPNFLGVVADDFAFDREGNAWITQDPSNGLLKVSPAGYVSLVLGGLNQSEIAGDTSAKFGRTKYDRDVLYLTTNGGLADPPVGGIVGGKLLAVDTACLK